MIWFSGCATVNIPKRDDHERCIVSIKFNKCRCHTYRISPEKVGRVSDSYDKPLIYCDNLIGKSPDTTVDDVLWLEELFQAVKDANTSQIPPLLMRKPDLETPENIKSLVLH